MHLLYEATSLLGYRRSPAARGPTADFRQRCRVCERCRKWAKADDDRGNLRASVDTGVNVDAGVKERTAQSLGEGSGPAIDRSRLILTGLLLVIVIVGVRSGFALTWQSGWHGPWHDRQAGIATAVALELVCAVLLGALLVRAARSRDSGSVARALRRLLTWLVIAVMVALGGALISLFHFRLTPRKPLSPAVRSAVPRRRQLVPHGSSETINLDIARDVAVGIVVLAVVALVVILLQRRRRYWRVPLVVADVDEGTALREAVVAARMALGELSEPRMAIINCYLAMERSLADAGAVRVAAETPDELLARSSAAGLLRGDAPVELTALFYEARFSTHPVPESSRERALRAIDAILADLDGDRAGTGTAPAGSVTAP